MNDVNNYPSCIKIPGTNLKQNVTPAMFPQKFDVREALLINDKLISLANQVLGEGKWSHTVTSQTLDFVDSVLGVYHCGCITFVKIQLQDGTFHEDMGYYLAEATTKGISVHTARAGSLTEAFKKVLQCFGSRLETEVEKLMKKGQCAVTSNNETENIQHSLSHVQGDILEPCARSTPYITRKPAEQDVTENESNSKSPIDYKGHSDVQQGTSMFKHPHEQKGQILIHSRTSRSKSPIEQKEQNVQHANNSKPRSKSSCDLKRSPAIQSSNVNQQKEQSNISAQKEQEQNKGLSEEELLRMERKRKQMEKQAEYKRLMKEREQQKMNENKKANPKY